MDGILVVNKEKGYTSRDIVNIVSKYVGTKKVGHTGTLDPLATGVLVLPINKGLKIAEILGNHDKEYIADVIIGYETDTLDITGNILKEKYIDITYDDVIDALNKFKGKIIQKVPLYSAIKVNGKRLYEYARNNIPVNLPEKEVYIKNIELVSDVIKSGNIYKFKIKCLCSKGTYIRSLIRDIGYYLGSYGTMEGLLRTKVGDFKIEDSYTLDNIKNNNYKLVKIDEILDYKKIVISDKDILFKISNGNKIDNIYNIIDKVMLYDKDKLLAIYIKEDKYLKPYKMLI